MKEEEKNLLLDDQLFENLRRRRADIVREYRMNARKQTVMDMQCMELMNKLNDSSTPITDMVDGYVNYKLLRFQDKMNRTIKKIKGEQIYEPDSSSIVSLTKCSLLKTVCLSPSDKLTQFTSSREPYQRESAGLVPFPTLLLSP